MEYVRLGYIRKPFGLKGGLRCFSLTDFGKERFKKGNKLSLLNESTNERLDVTVKAFRPSGDFYFLDLEEITSIEQAEELKGYAIEIDKDSAPMPEGYFRFSDLVGCQLQDEKTGECLGMVSDVLDYAVTKTLRIKREKGKDFFVPFHDSFIKDVDLDSKIIKVEVVEGML